MRKLIILDRDGVIVQETADEMINTIEKFEFLPGAIANLAKIAKELDYEFVMFTNQDGLGTDTYPKEQFWPLQDLVIRTLRSEGVRFDSIHVDTHYAHENSPFRKPGIVRLEKYTNGDYDLENSFVVGDRWSDMELAKNLGAKGILINSEYSTEPDNADIVRPSIAKQVRKWDEIYAFFIEQKRVSKVQRRTSETRIDIQLNLDGTGQYSINTGLNFFDHMLEQLARHGGMDLEIKVKGDLEIDEHHTIEDTAISLGLAMKEALGKKVGIERYGFALPMDDVLAQVAMDFGGRSWLVWEVDFKRERIGDVPTEMFYHFFKSFADSSNCNLNIKCEGDNEHHKIESIFKAWARSIKMAVKRDVNNMVLPSTKGVL